MRVSIPNEDYDSASATLEANDDVGTCIQSLSEAAAASFADVANSYEYTGGVVQSNSCERNGSSEHSLDYIGDVVQSNVCHDAVTSVSELCVDVSVLAIPGIKVFRYSFGDSFCKLVGCFLPSPMLCWAILAARGSVSGAI